MRTKTDITIKVSVFLAVVFLIAGCTAAGQKCNQDSDCGGDLCSENFRKVVSSTCVDGRCNNTSTECDATKICVADSSGVKCVPMDPDSGKPIISCSNNTINPNVLSFNPTDFICSDDCPADSYCNGDCICKKREDISCSMNTENSELFGENFFDQVTEMCVADCPGVFNCNAQCICEQRPRSECPLPVFTSNYSDPPPILYDIEYLNDLWSDDPRKILYLGETINIPAYVHERDGVFYYIPYPDIQLVLVLNTEYVPQYGAFCVNDYYDGVLALDIDLNVLFKPEQTCIWGGVEGFVGVLTVCPEDLVDWLDARAELWGIESE